MKGHFFKKIFVVLFSFFFYVPHVFAVASDSTRLVSPYNSSATTTQMMYTKISATIIVRVIQSGFWVGCCCNIFPYIAQCPAGSVPDTANDVISTQDMVNCFNGGSCKPGITHTGIGTGSVCGKTYKTTWRLSTTVKCNLSLQGWFPSSNIKNILAGRQVAAAENFHLGTYTVTYNDYANYNIVSTCSISPASPTIPSYPAMCPISYYVASYTPP